MIPVLTSSFLRPFSKFIGQQQSDKQMYQVEVELKYVDMAQSSLCGYLKIEGKPLSPPCIPQLTQLTSHHRTDARPPHPNHLLRRRNHRPQIYVPDSPPFLGRNRQDGHATLESLPCLAPTRQTSQKTRLPLQELHTARKHLHALERIVPRPRPPRARNLRREFRGLLLYLL